MLMSDLVFNDGNNVPHSLQVQLISNIGHGHILLTELGHPSSNIFLQPCKQTPNMYCNVKQAVELSKSFDFFTQQTELKCCLSVCLFIAIEV